MTTMRVPLLDLKGQYAAIRAEVREAIDRVCDSQYFILGPEVTGLEEEVARFCGSKHAVGMSSGTDALLAALMALGVKAGDEVVTTTYSFFATAGVVARLGATPVFVDIDPATFNIDPAQVRAKVTSKAKAILPVHLYGRCADMDPILEVARERGVPVVEDAAQAIGAADARGRKAGSMGKMGCFSFFPSKNLGGFGDGGMVVTDDGATAESLRMMRMHGMKPKYVHRVVGGNFRLDALQAAVLRVKLRHLPKWTAARRENAERYRRLFAEAGLAGKVVLPADVPGHIYNQFVIRVPRRDALRKRLEENGVGSEVYYPIPLHLQECFAGLGHRKGSLPHAEKAAEETLALPIYPELTEEQQRIVAGEIARFFADGGKA
jgi:dTDP-4-amino-4,6-dideoxygalactose transaminase